MRTIWKFQFKIDDEVEIEMPIGARILHVGTQGDERQTALPSPFLWAMVESTAKKHRRKFLIFGTGHELPRLPIDEPLPNDLQHIGTFQMRGGLLVWHMFEKPEWMD